MKTSFLVNRKVTVTVMSAAVIAGCTGTSSNSSNISPLSNADTTQTAASFNKAQTICQGISDPNNPYQSIFAGERSGLQGRLYYLTPDQYGQYNHVADEISHGVDSGNDVFLNDLFTPTRLFTEGFSTADGNLVQANGQLFTEYFSLFLESQIQLGPQDSPGNYQLAVLADDGAVLSIRDQYGNFNQFLNDDGVHPTQMTCATKPLDVEPYVQIPMQMQFFQGPRYHIALMLMWRPWPTNPAEVNDPLCGQSGNELFFNPNVVPSTPNQAYNDLLSRGWKPLTSSNFVIPGQNRINPCNDPSWQQSQ